MNTSFSRALYWGCFMVAAVFVFGCAEHSEGQSDELDPGAQASALGADQAQRAANTPQDKLQRHRLDKSESRDLVGNSEADSDDEDPRFVRETGFRPIDDGMSEVRETGFLPAPNVRLVRVDGDVGVIAWGVVEAAVHYVVSGLRQGDDGNLVETFDLRIDGTTARIDTQGHRTVVNVYSVGQNGKRRSGPSNKVAIDPAD